MGLLYLVYRNRTRCDSICSFTGWKSGALQKESSKHLNFILQPCKLQLSNLLLPAGNRSTFKTSRAHSWHLQREAAKHIERSQPLLYFHKKLKQPLASYVASPPFLFGSFCYIFSLKVSRLSPPGAGGKNQSQGRIACLGSRRWRRCGLPLSLLQSSKGRQEDVWMVPEDMCVLASMYLRVHTWAVAAAAGEGLVSLDHNEASSRLGVGSQGALP